MIVFDLKCSASHVFEAWFGSNEDYEDQRNRGLVSCPLCGDGTVGKAAMAPRIVQGTDAPENVKAMLTALAEAQRSVLENSTYVGDRFASEARAMHSGDAAPKSIHGVASLVEAKALQEEGVPIVPLPLPVLPPGQEN